MSGCCLPIPDSRFPTRANPSSKTTNPKPQRLLRTGRPHHKGTDSLKTLRMIVRVNTRAGTELWLFSALAVQPFRRCRVFKPACAQGRLVAGLRCPGRSPPRRIHMKQRGTSYLWQAAQPNTRHPCAAAFLCIAMCACRCRPLRTGAAASCPPGRVSGRRAAQGAAAGRRPPLPAECKAPGRRASQRGPWATPAACARRARLDRISPSWRGGAATRQSRLHASEHRTTPRS